MRRLVSKLVVCAGIIVVLVGTPSIASGAPQHLPDSQSGQAPRTMTNADVITMTTGKLADDIIAGAIQQADKVTFDLTPEGLIALKAAHVSDAVILAMQNRTKKVQPNLVSGAGTSTTPASTALAAWEKDYQKAEIRRKQGRMGMIIGPIIGVAGFVWMNHVLKDCPNASDPAFCGSFYNAMRWVYVGIGAGGAALGAMRFTSANAKLRELEANKPTTSAAIPVTSHHAIQASLGGVLSLGYRYSW